MLPAQLQPRRTSLCRSCNPATAPSFHLFSFSISCSGFTPQELIVTQTMITTAVLRQVSPTLRAGVPDFNINGQLQQIPKLPEGNAYRALVSVTGFWTGFQTLFLVLSSDFFPLEGLTSLRTFWRSEAVATRALSVELWHLTRIVAGSFAPVWTGVCFICRPAYSPGNLRAPQGREGPKTLQGTRSRKKRVSFLARPLNFARF